MPGWAKDFSWVLLTRVLNWNCSYFGHEKQWNLCWTQNNQYKEKSEEESVGKKQAFWFLFACRLISADQSCVCVWCKKNCSCWNIISKLLSITWPQFCFLNEDLAHRLYWKRPQVSRCPRSHLTSQYVDSIQYMSLVWVHTKSQRNPTVLHMHLQHTSAQHPSNNLCQFPNQIPCCWEEERSEWNIHVWMCSLICLINIVLNVFLHGVRRHEDTDLEAMCWSYRSAEKTRPNKRCFKCLHEYPCTAIFPGCFSCTCYTNSWCHLRQPAHTNHCYTTTMT